MLVSMPLMKWIALAAPGTEKIKRLGFLVGQIKAPEEFDRMDGREVEQLFDGETWSCCWIPRSCYGRDVAGQGAEIGANVKLVGASANFNEAGELSGAALQVGPGYNIGGSGTVTGAVSARRGVMTE